MTRVHSHRSQYAAHHASAHDRPRAIRKKKPYKILLEAVTQEKKKLRSAVRRPSDYLSSPILPSNMSYSSPTQQTRLADIRLFPQVILILPNTVKSGVERGIWKYM
jgi:hypothetical protein